MSGLICWSLTESRVLRVPMLPDFDSFFKSFERSSAFSRLTSYKKRGGEGFFFKKFRNITKK